MAEASQLWRLIFLRNGRAWTLTCPRADEGTLTDLLMDWNNDPACPIKEWEIGHLRAAFLQKLRVDGFVVVQLGSVNDRILKTDEAKEILVQLGLMPEVDSGEVAKN